MTSAPGRYQLIVFDLDGVLVDTESGHARAYDDLWARVGIEGPEYGRIAGIRTAEVVSRATASLAASDEQRAEWVRFKQERARHYLTGSTRPFPDVGPTVTALYRAGFKLAVGTGSSRRTATTVLEAAGILGLFAAVVTGDDVSRGKPAPDIFLAAFGQTGSAPEAALVVEDTRVGLEAANASGAWSAAVRSGARLASERFIGTYPDLGALARTLQEPA